MASAVTSCQARCHTLCWFHPLLQGPLPELPVGQPAAAGVAVVAVHPLLGLGVARPRRLDVPGPDDLHVAGEGALRPGGQRLDGARPRAAVRPDPGVGPAVDGAVAGADPDDQPVARVLAAEGVAAHDLLDAGADLRD